MEASPNNTAVPGPRALRFLEVALMVTAAACVMAICALIFIGIVSRVLFSWSVPDLEILVRDLMIASVILPLAYVTVDRAHISVSVFTSMMPDKVQPWLNFLSSIIGFLVLLPILYGGYQGMISVIENGDYFYGELEFPEWPGKTAFFVGYLVFVLRLAHLVGHDFIIAMRQTMRPSGPSDPSNLSDKE